MDHIPRPRGGAACGTSLAAAGRHPGAALVQCVGGRCRRLGKKLGDVDRVECASTAAVFAGDFDLTLLGQEVARVLLAQKFEHVLGTAPRAAAAELRFTRTKHAQVVFGKQATEK